MNHLIVISLLGFGLSGCSRGPQGANDAAHRVWRSPDSSLSQRVQAASQLFPKGTKMVDAERVLGEPTRRERWHGIRIVDPKYVLLTNGVRSLDGTSKSEDYDEDHYVYEFSAGDIVRLRFDGLAFPSSWQDRPLIDITSGHINDIQIIPLKKVQR